MSRSLSQQATISEITAVGTTTSGPQFRVCIVSQEAPTRCALAAARETSSAIGLMRPT